MAHNTQRKAWNEAMRSAAGASAIPPALQQRTQKRRSDRRKKQERREKARKILELGDDKEYRAALWLDALEGVDPSAPSPEDDEEFDELDDILEERKRKRRRGAPAQAKAGVLPKQFRPRTLASILLEEMNREDSATRDFVNSEARLPQNQQLPPRKFCPVTGMEGIYTDAKSGIPYANLKALEQIGERAPPWMTLGGSAAYWEAVRSISDEDVTFGHS